MPDALLEAVARRFRTLGAVSRLRILSVLMHGPRTVGELVVQTGLSQSNLSRQLTELEADGCVLRQRRGRAVEVSIADPQLQALCDLVCDTVIDRASQTSNALQR